MASEIVPTDWRIGSYCDTNACVEVGYVADEVHVRHSASSGSTIVFTRAEWDAFLLSAKDGEFD